MPLAQAVQPYLDPNWQASQPISLPPPQEDPQSLQSAVAPAPVAPPPQGIGYTPGASAQPDTGIPAPQPVGNLSREDALAIGAWTPNGGKAVPAHWTPTTRSEGLEGRQASPEYQQAIGDKLGADQDQLLAQARYDAQAGGASNEAQRRLAIFDAAQARDAAARAQDQQAKLAQDRQHIQDLMAKASKPDQSAADEYWGNKSTFSKIATGLSMALKGFVFSGYGRGQDPGQWLNQQINQTVAEQQNRAAKTREAVGDATTLYGQNKQALGDDERSKLATELALRQQVASTLDRRIAEATADPAAQLRGAQLKKALADQNAATLEQFWDKTADKHTSTEGEAFRPATPAGGGKRDPLEVLRRSAEARKLGVPILNDTDAANAQLEQQKGQLGLRKDVAEVGKSEAEAAALQNKGGGKAAEAIATGTSGNTNWDPRRWIQGTDAYKASLDDDQTNLMFKMAVSKAGLSPRLVREADGALLQNGDTPETKALKRRNMAKLLGAAPASAIPGFTPGAIPDEGGEP